MEDNSQVTEKQRVKKNKLPTPIITQTDNLTNNEIVNGLYTQTYQQYGYNGVVYSPRNSDMLLLSPYQPMIYNPVLYSPTTVPQSHQSFPVQYHHPHPHTTHLPHPQTPPHLTTTHQTILHSPSPHLGYEITQIQIHPQHSHIPTSHLHHQNNQLTLQNHHSIQINNPTIYSHPHAHAPTHPLHQNHISTIPSHSSQIHHNYSNLHQQNHQNGQIITHKKNPQNGHNYNNNNISSNNNNHINHTSSTSLSVSSTIPQLSSINHLPQSIPGQISLSFPMSTATIEEHQRTINNSSTMSNNQTVKGSSQKKQSNTRKVSKIQSNVFFPESINESQHVYHKYYKDSQNYLVPSPSVNSSSVTIHTISNDSNQLTYSPPDNHQENVTIIENNNIQVEDIIIDFNTILGRVFSMSQDQAGCKILQKIVKRGSQEDLEIMYQEVADVLGTILKDVFGNYFFQCLYEQSNLELKRKIVESVLYDIFEGSKNCYGTRSIQCLIKHSCDDTDLFTQLKSQLTPHLYQLCTDRYGNHCIKQLMMSGTYEMNIDIVEFLKSHWYEFCIHQYCNSVIQTCLKTYPTLTLDFCQLIISEVLALIQSEYGNYVIQCLVKNFPEFKETICRLVISYLVPLSRDKYSSMVLQDCVRFASEEIQIEYVREIISSGSLLQLSLHKYSNFVIQEALSVLPLNLKSQLVNILQPHRVALSKSPFGATIVKHLI